MENQCFGPRYWYEVLVQGFGLRYWSEVLVQGIGLRFWSEVLVQAFGPRFWSEVFRKDKTNLDDCHIIIEKVEILFKTSWASSKEGKIS